MPGKSPAPDSDEEYDEAVWIPSPLPQKLPQAQIDRKVPGSSKGAKKMSTRDPLRPSSPLMLFDYGSASIKPIATTAFTRKHPNGAKVPSNPRYLLSFPPGGAQCPNTILEPHFLLPSIAPMHASHFEHIDHQPLLKSKSFSCLQKEKEKDMVNFFKKDKVSGMKGMTNAFRRHYSHVWGTKNKQHIEGILEAQKQYDAQRGYGFKDRDLEHFQWLEKESSDLPILCFLDKPRQDWSEIERKAYEILSNYLL